MRNKILENFINLDNLNLRKEYCGVSVFETYVKIIAAGGSIDLVALHFGKKRRSIKKKIKSYIKENFSRIGFKNTAELDDYIKTHIKNEL